MKTFIAFLTLVVSGYGAFSVVDIALGATPDIIHGFGLGTLCFTMVAIIHARSTNAKS